MRPSKNYEPLDKPWYCPFIRCSSICPKNDYDNAIVTAIFSGAWYVLIFLAIMYSPCYTIDEKVGSIIALTMVIGAMWIVWVIPFVLEWSCYSADQKELLK